MRMVIADYLRECGYRVFEATGSEDAIAILGTDAKVDAIFSEVRLHGKMDGFGLAQWVRANRPQIEIVLTTGVKKTAEKAGDLCEDGPLEKPYNPDQVVRRLRLLFERRHRSRR
jgi:CheY-like chemotaxis protein